MTVQRCDCGAEAGVLGLCVDYYHGVLAEEQGDPEMYRWHAIVVCSYLLQHPEQGDAKYLDGQFRQLQLYLDKGLDAVLRLAARQIARNKHGRQLPYDMTPLEVYAPLPTRRPEHFNASFTDLPFENGSFVANGYPAYGRQFDLIAQATIEAWTRQDANRS